MPYGLGAGATGVPPFQFAGDLDVIAERFARLERAVFLAAPRPPAVDKWVLGVDPVTRAFTVTDLILHIRYPVLLGPGTPVPAL